MKKRIKIPIYNQFVWVSDKMPEKYKWDYAACFDFKTWTLYYQPEYMTVQRLCHECVHIANQLCKRLLIDLDYDNDEAMAYLSEFLYERIHNIIFCKGANNE